MTCLSSLPDEVLKLIMHTIPLRDRLSSCALVSRRMHAAAVAATDELYLDFERGIRPKHIESAVAWLCNHGQHLTSFRVRSWPLLLQELPCPNLVDLHISSGRVQLDATADGQSGVLQDCTKLTRLELSCRYVNIPEDGLVDSLSHLVHLQELVFKGKGLSVATLPRLQHLTYLDVYHLSLDNLMQLSGLTNLQELHLGHVLDTTGRPASARGAVMPASLKTLNLSESMDAGALSVVPTGLQDLHLHCGLEVDPPDGTGSWLSSLGRLQHLTNLYVWLELEWPDVAGRVYSALTASSSLVRLAVEDSRGYGFPDDAWQFVFPVGRKLPHLTHLNLFENAIAMHDSMSFPTWCAADLSRLVSCCPSLCDVRTLPLQPGGHVSELHKLTGLTSLSMFHDPTIDTDNSDDPDSSDVVEGFEEAMRGLATVTQLQDLGVKRVSQAVKYGSLLPLTSLTALTDLGIEWIPDIGSDGEQPEYGLGMGLTNKQEGSAPDVWQQLLERCTAEPEGQPKPGRAPGFCVEGLEKLQEQLSAQLQAATQQAAGLQEQLPEQEQVAAQPLFGLQWLQQLHEAGQTLLPHNQDSSG